MNGLLQTGVFTGASRKQLSETVFRALQQTMVTYMSVLTKLTPALEKCLISNIDGAQYELDAAVALFVGSIDAFKSAWGHSESSGKQLHSLVLVGDEFLILVPRQETRRRKSTRSF
jgi:hypothetical protein